MTPVNIAITTFLNGICLGAILAATMTLILRFFRRLNSTTRFTILWMTLVAVVALLATPLARRASVVEPRSESRAVVSPSAAESPHLRRQRFTGQERGRIPTSTRFHRKGTRGYPSKFGNQSLLRFPPATPCPGHRYPNTL